MALLNAVEILRFAHEENLGVELGNAQFRGELMLDAGGGIHAPHTLARQLARQLNVTLQHRNANPIRDTVHAGDQVDLIAQMVDIETTGYRPALCAREHLAVLRERLSERSQCELIWYVRDSHIAIAEEDYFFLNQLLSELPYRLRVYCLQAPELPSHWPITVTQFIEAAPMVVPQSFISPLAGEHWISVSTQQEQASPKHIDSLMKHGLQAIEAGSYALGLSLLDRTTHLVGKHPAAVTLRLLSDGLRIGLERFSEVVDLALPDLPLSDKQRGQFLQYKGWGLVMTGQAAAAQPYFEQALQLMHCTPPSTEYLYLQNIYALSQFRQGKRERAMQFERAIALSLGLQSAPSPHLIYLNSMNTARLLLSMNQIEEARVYFERAFATHEGLRTLGDHLMRHVYLGRIAALTGQHATARRHHLRAALFWLASDLRDALPIRVARLLLGNALPERLTWPAAISQALYQLLHGSAQATGIPDGVLNRQALSKIPDFIFLPEHPGIVCERVIFTPDWTLATSAHKVSRTALEPSDRQLAQLVWALIQNDTTAAKLATVNSLVVDDNLGVDMPETAAQAAVLARRLGVPYRASSLENEGEIDWALSLVPTTQLRWPAADVCVVNFMRYRQPIRLQGIATRVLGLLEVDQPKLVSELNARLGIKVPATLLDELLEQRLIRMELVMPAAHAQPAMCA